MSLYIREVPHVLSGEEHAILWSLLLQRLETQPDGPRRDTMLRLRDRMDLAARKATLDSERPERVSAIRLVGETGDDTPLSHGFRRALLSDDIDEGDEAA